MGRKPEIRDKSQSGKSTLAISLLVRATQVLANRESPIPAGGRQLEELLEYLHNNPLSQETAAGYLAELNALSDKEWRKLVLDSFCGLGALYSKACIKYGNEDVLANLGPEENARVILKVWLKINDFDKLLPQARVLLRELLENLAQGRLNEQDTSIKGYFTTDNSKLLAIVELIVSVFTDKSLGENVADAVQLIQKHIDAQPALKAAVEIMENKYKFVRTETDQDFKEFWKAKKAQFIGRIVAEGLKLPVSYFVHPNEEFDETKIFLFEKVYEELLARVSCDSDKVLHDAMEGRLTNSLVISVVHDLIDEIRILSAPKRGIERTEYFGKLDKERGDDNDTPFVETQPDPVGEAFVEEIENSESLKEMVKCLPENQQGVFKMKFEGELSQQLIASKLGKSETWVKNKIKSARGKLKIEHNRNKSNQ